MRLVCKTLSFLYVLQKPVFPKANLAFVNEIALARRTRIVPCLIPLKRVSFSTAALALRDVMGAEDALKTMECIPKPSAGSGPHFLTEVLMRPGENKLRIKDLVRAVRRACRLGRLDTPIIARDTSSVVAAQGGSLSAVS